MVFNTTAHFAESVTQFNLVFVQNTAIYSRILYIKLNIKKKLKCNFFVSRLGVKLHISNVCKTPFFTNETQVLLEKFSKYITSLLTAVKNLYIFVYIQPGLL